MHVERGLSLSSTLKESRDYKNPAFLQKMVTNQHIDEYGSAYPPDRFDPRALNAEVRRCTTRIALSGLVHVHACYRAESCMSINQSSNQ